jgi:hypothetical protein
MQVQIHIDNIKVSKKQRRKIDSNKVEKHRIAFERGLNVMPIDVVRIDNNVYNICGNGRHRYFGAVEAGVMYIDVNVLN